MLKNARVLSALATRLLLGSALPLTVVASATLLVGCEDESQPETWVKRLDDPAKRAGAVKRLNQFYEDGMTKANNNREAPEMKALLAKIVKPMSDAYVKGDLDEKTRKDLLKSLAGTRDPNASGAIIKALTDFAAGKADASEATEAAHFVKTLKTKEAAGPLLDAFMRVNPSKKELGPPYIAVQEAMLAIPDPAWKGKLIDEVNKPVDPKNIDELRNAIYHQTVSAMILGELKAAEATKVLFKAMVTPDKKDVAATALMALVKIGKPSVIMLLDVMNGKDADIAEYVKKVNPKGYVASAAATMGLLGRTESLAPMIAAGHAATDEGDQAHRARELAKLPASPESIKTVQTVFEKTSNGAALGNGQNARIALAEQMADWMDSSIVPWLLKQVEAVAKGAKEKEEADLIQGALLQSAMKLMRKEQVDDVKKLVDKEGSELEKAAFKLSSDVLTACTENLGCYLGKLEDEKVQEKNQQFTGIKAAFMLGMLGKDDTKAEIVKRWPKIKNASIKFVSAKAIDKLSPKGDAKIADELQKIVEADAARGDALAVQGNSPLKQYIPRLRARAE